MSAVARAVREPQDFLTQNSHPTACYAVTGTADPGLLPRLIEPFAKLGLVPRRLNARSSAGWIELDMQVDGLNPDQAALAAARLRNVIGVDSVLLSLR